MLYKQISFKERLINKIKDKEYCNIGYYKRLYPDTLQTTMGHFQMKISYWIDINHEIIDCEFDIIAKEKGGFKIKSIDFHKHFSTNKVFLKMRKKF